MSIVKEFKEFAMRGNVIDLAIGIIIGGAFGKIVSSLVSDILMPPLGLLIGGVNFTDLKITIKQADLLQMSPPVTINYGNFIQVVFDFLIIAFAIFMLVKAINRMKKKEEVASAEPPKPSNEEVLLSEIRDLLKNR